MASRLSPGDADVELLEYSGAAALGLICLILIFGPARGAHFNPAVTLADVVLGRGSGQGLSVRIAEVCLPVQIVGGIGRAVVANLMFAWSRGYGGICPAFPGKRYLDWTAEDPVDKGVETVRPIRDEIECRVRVLIDEIVPTDTLRPDGSCRRQARRIGPCASPAGRSVSRRPAEMAGFFAATSAVPSLD